MYHLDLTSVSENKKIIGKIIHLSQNGYGFIESKELQFTRIYFSWKNLHPAVQFTRLKVGDLLEFFPYFTEGRGYKAMKITKVQELSKMDQSSNDNLPAKV